eukprot:TRINITY_DN1899_c0_g2_i1.p1 TRINITY_DN1899_c0_g2~~TRINITY_DN1899_c0_g2_i1.p1  ORF type:complete len:185 (+),score=36.80 TRINITY_DN1899_c0_g2_i1:3-557(+)
MSKKNSAQYRIAIMGDGSVGKTSITLKYCHNKFQEEYDPTIEDSYTREITVDGKTTLIEILDTAGQDDFKTLRPNWIRRSNAYILTYSITSKLTFGNLDGFYKDIVKVKPKPITLVVGNKKDLPTPREVTFEEGNNFAKDIDSEYLEVSAKTGEGVTDAFTKIVQKLMSSEGDSNQEGGCCIIY